MKKIKAKMLGKIYSSHVFLSAKCHLYGLMNQMRSKLQPINLLILGKREKISLKKSKTNEGWKTVCQPHPTTHLAEQIASQVYI